MTLRRIFADQPLQCETTIRLTGDAANHIRTVLRLRMGDGLVVFDGSGRDFAAEIAAFGRDEVIVRIGIATDIHTESPADITLLQGICRGPRMDTVIQKATELGVTRIQPVLTERSVVRLAAGQTAHKQEHWRWVAVSAAEQCGRSRIPEMLAPRALADVIGLGGSLQTRLLLDPEGKATLGSFVKTTAPIGLLIGPEGGLTRSERRLAIDSGYQPVGLGPRILRAETAPLAALAVLQFIAGDLG